MAETLTKATLETLDGKTKFTFLINPEAIQVQASANFSSLGVLNTNQPLTYYQNSASTFSIPMVKFWPIDGDISQDENLRTLTSYTQIADSGNEPPLLKFSFGNTRYERIYLQSLQYSATQWRSDGVLWATGSLSFILAPKAPDPLTEPVQTELSEREQDEAATLVDDLLTRSGAKAKAGLTPEDKPVVDSQGNVKIKDTAIGHLKDLLGDQLPDQWANLNTTPEAQKAATETPVEATP